MNRELIQINSGTFLVQIVPVGSEKKNKKHILRESEVSYWAEAFGQSIEWKIPRELNFTALFGFMGQLKTHNTPYFLLKVIPFWLHEASIVCKGEWEEILLGKNSLKKTLLNQQRNL